MKIIVIGKTGQLAQELARLAPYQVNCLGRNEVDLLNCENVYTRLQEHKPNAVINASAYTAVDRAEQETTEAYNLNAKGVENLGKVCAELGIPFVHVSTDFVFDGKSSTPYKETDSANPIGVYGSTKYQGEQLLLQVNPKVIIIRTSWVYGIFGQNFMKTMIRLSQERSELGVVNDQWGSPTSSKELAKGILHAVQHPEWIPGIYHFSNSGTTTWFEFASTILELTEAKTIVKPITTNQYPTPAKRPKFSKLDTAKWESTYGYTIPHWKDSLKEILSEYEF